MEACCFPRHPCLAEDGRVAFSSLLEICRLPNRINDDRVSLRLLLIQLFNRHIWQSQNLREISILLISELGDMPRRYPFHRLFLIPFCIS